MAQPKFLLPIGVGVAVLALTTWVAAKLPELRIIAATSVALPDGSSATPQIYSTAIDGDTAFLAAGPSDTVTLLYEIDKVPKIVIRNGDPSPTGEGTVTQIGAFHMTTARLLFQVRTTAGESLLLTHDGSKIRSAFQEWYPDISLGVFDIEAANAAGDALLRRMSTSGDTLGFVRVPKGPDGVGNTIEIVRNGDAVPGVAGSSFELPNQSLPAYMADDGMVVFESAYSDGINSGFGVFFRLPASSKLEQLTVDFPGALTGNEICCDLLGVDKNGVVGVVASRDGEEYLFVGKPLATSLALTVPIEGLPIPNAPELLLTTLAIDEPSLGVGQGGDFVWTTQVEATAGGFPWTVLSYEPGVGLRMLVKEGDPTPDGIGQFSANYSQLIANGKGGFQFTSVGSVYRTSRTNDVITVDRIAGPGDTFAAPDGTMVTAAQVESHLDSRAFEAGRVAFTVYYTDPDTNIYEWMTYVDGTPLPPQKSGGCRVTDPQPDLPLLGGVGLVLLGLSRRSRRARTHA